MISIFELHASICKTLANPKRLEILDALREKELTASQLLENIETSKANLSQHMKILVEKGVVVSRKAGLNVFYRLSDSRITAACELMRQVLIKNLEQSHGILEELKKSD